MDRVLLKNIFSLFSIQGMNYFLPLIAIPYLVRILGLDGFGTYSLVLAIIQYFVILTDYGFNLSATKQIAINRECRDSISRIFWSVLFSKTILFIVGYLALTISLSYFKQLGHSQTLLEIGYLIVLGSVLFPIWLFQGCEQMFWIAISNFIARLIGLACIFLLVNEQGDLYLAILIQGIVAIIAACIALFYVFITGLVTYKKITFIDVWLQIKNGWDIFISTSFVSLYTTSIPLMLGATSGTASVGIYSAADKIRQAVQGFLGPVSQALYPRLSKLMIDSKNEALILVKKAAIYFVFPLFLLSLFVAIFSEEIVYFAYGKGYEVSAEVLKIIIWIPPVVAVGNLLGVQILLPMGMFKAFSRTYIIAGIIGFPLIYTFSKQYSYWGVSVVSVFIEIFVAASFFILVKYKLMLLNNKGN